MSALEMELIDQFNCLNYRCASMPLKRMRRNKTFAAHAAS